MVESSSYIPTCCFVRSFDTESMRIIMKHWSVLHEAPFRNNDKSSNDFVIYTKYNVHTYFNGSHLLLTYVLEWTLIFQLLGWKKDHKYVQIKLSLTQLNSAWLSLTQLDSAQLSSTQLNSAWLRSTQHDSARLSATQHNSGQVSATQCNSALLRDSVQLRNFKMIIKI